MQALAGSEPMRCSPDPANLPADQVAIGLLRLGGIECAVPVQYLREAIKPPPRLSPLMTSSPYVAGAVDVRGDLVPVVNLRRALNAPEAVEKDPRIVIVRHRGYLFGIMVDMLGEVVSISDKRFQDVEVLQPDSPPLIRQVFSLDEGRRVISMLCLDGVIQQVDVPLTKEVLEEEKAVQSDVSHQWQPYVLFECHGARLALNAEAVETVIDLNSAASPLRSSEGCLGLLQIGTRRLAVLDPLRILGLGQADPQSDRQVMVIKIGANQVGVLIHRVVQIARIDDTTRRKVPSMAFTRPGFFDGMLPFGEYGEFLKIQATRFLATDDLATMASIHGKSMSETVVHAQSSRDKDHAERTEAYLTFRSRQEFATPLRHVREILPIPARFTPINLPGDPRIGLFTHRDEVVPIIDMAALMQHGASTLQADSRLLLVDAANAKLALLVEQVQAIEYAQWIHPPIAQAQWRHAEELEAALHAMSLLTLGEQSPRRGIPSLDLPRIARAIEARFEQDEMQGDAPDLAMSEEASAA